LMVSRLLFERAPEALEPKGDLDAVLSYYGLTRARMSAEMIRWLEGVRLEDPATHAYLTSDPAPIADMIDRWDLVFSTGMTTEYPKRRRWNSWMAFREFVQNALDIEERAYGYEGIRVYVFQDHLGVHIADRGPGITFEAFRMGGSDKACHERGYFGEGLKVAGAHFVGEGHPVYAFTRMRGVYKMCSPPGTDLVVVVMGRSRYVPLGTEVIVYGATMTPDLVVKTVFQEWMATHPDHRVLSVSKYGTHACPRGMPNIIVAGPENVNTLWVRDIYVGELDSISRYPSAFGYNLWWVPLEPNRVNVQSQSDLASEAARSYIEASVRELLDLVVVKEGVMYKVMPNLFETEVVDWFDASYDVKRAVAEWVSSKGLAVTTEERIADWMSYMGVRPLIITRKTSFLFSLAPKAESEVIKKSLERVRTGDETAIPEEALTLDELVSLNYAKAIFTAVQTRIFPTRRMPEIVVSSSLAGAGGLHAEEKIYIERSELESPDTAAWAMHHEYSHYYGDMRFGGARDLSEGFERALASVVGDFAFSTYLNPVVWEVLTRIRNGGWKAWADWWDEKDKIWRPRSTTPGDEVYAEATNRFTMAGYAHEWDWAKSQINTMAPPVIGFSVDDRGYVWPELRMVSFASTVRGLIPGSLPPDPSLYWREAERAASTLKGYAIHPPIGIIFIYDPWKDEYRVWWERR
jgi:hypothetical protein